MSFKLNDTNNNQIIIHHEIVCGLNFIFYKQMGGRKHSLNLVGSGRGQRPLVFFILYIFENHMCIFNIYNMKI